MRQETGGEAAAVPGWGAVLTLQGWQGKGAQDYLEGGWARAVRETKVLKLSRRPQNSKIPTD